MRNKIFRLIYLSCIWVFLPLLAHAELSSREVWDNFKKLLETGSDNFNKILAGGASMDRHFRHSEVDKNLPALLGLIGVWHSSFCNYTNLAIIPYESRLEFFPRYIQQLQMESNGKNSSRYSETVSGLMSPVVWGDIGTNSQHSFFQYLHQGTHTVPIEFIVGRSSSVGLDEEHHDLLKLNCVAQSEALMSGNSDNEEDADWLLNKVLNMRIFNDEKDIMNLSLIDTNGSIMIISQFTLMASTKKGNRPSYINAANHKHAVPLYNYFIRKTSNFIKEWLG